MKIAIITYAISWLLLLLVYIGSRFKKNNTLNSEKEPSYLYAIIIAIAPLTILLILHILISDFITGKKQKKERAEREAKEEREKAYCKEALAKYEAALELPHESHSYNFAMTAQTLVEKIISKKDYDSMLEYLDHLTLFNGASLIVEECKKTEHGDSSKLVVKTPDGVYDSNIWDYLKVEDSIDGAWQAYFLYKVWHILPLWWHANYSRRTYMYTKEDIAYIQPMDKESTEFIRQKVRPLIIEPEVVKAGNKYYVSCCFWSDFGGLLQELVEVSITDDKQVSFKDIEQKCLYKYECGILF